MSSRRDDHDTDTLTGLDPTLIDQSADAETVKQHAADPDAATHKLDPRVWAPLKVCPSCSLAWESTGDWCPSCGTAFRADQRDDATVVKPGRTGERPAARSPRPRRGAARNVAERSTAERRAVQPRPARGSGAGAPPRSRPAAQQPAPKSGGAGKVIAAVLLFALAIVFAFALGQQTRASKDEVDRQINEAVQNTKDSAVASFRREFENQRDRLQAEFNKRVKRAEEKARAEGQAQGQANAQANAQAQAEKQKGGVMRKLERCLSNFLVDC